MSRFFFCASRQKGTQTSSGIVLQDFIVFTLLSSPNTLDIFTVQMLFMNKGIVKGCKSSTEICIFTELPCLGRPIVEAEVRTCFLSLMIKSTKSQSKALCYPSSTDDTEK